MPARFLLVSSAISLLVYVNSAWTAEARCSGEDFADVSTPEAAPSPRTASPMETLQSLGTDTLRSGNAVDASGLLADAAQFDFESVPGAIGIQAGLSASAGLGDVFEGPMRKNLAAQMFASLTLSELPFDGARTELLADCGAHLAESAHLSCPSARDQLAPSSLTLALERTKCRQHSFAYGQYLREMGCLLEAVETGIRTDLSRLTQLEQAKKRLQQAVLQVEYEPRVIRNQGEKK